MEKPTFQPWQQAPLLGFYHHLFPKPPNITCDHLWSSFFAAGIWYKTAGPNGSASGWIQVSTSCWQAVPRASHPQATQGVHLWVFETRNHQKYQKQPRNSGDSLIHINLIRPAKNHRFRPKSYLQIWICTKQGGSSTQTSAKDGTTLEQRPIPNLASSEHIQRCMNMFEYVCIWGFVWLMNRSSLRAASCLVFKIMPSLNSLKPCIWSFMFEACILCLSTVPLYDMYSSIAF